MLISTISGGFGGYGGFGDAPATPDAPLVQGKDFNCNAAICYAIGKANQSLYETLQQTLNSAAPAGSKITTDGFIGDKTVALARALAQAYLERGLALEASVRTSFENLANGTWATHEAVAAQAPRLLYAFDNAAQQPGAANITPAEPSTDSGSIFDKIKSWFSSDDKPAAATTPAPTTSWTPTPGVPAKPAPAATAKKKTPTWVWVTAGVAGVILVGGMGYALFHKPSDARTSREFGRRYRRRTK